MFGSEVDSNFGFRLILTQILFQLRQYIVQYTVVYELEKTSNSHKNLTISS